MVEGHLKAGFEPFAKNYVKRVEDDGRPPVAVTRTPPPAQAAEAAAPSGAGAAGAATGRRMAAPVAEVKYVCVRVLLVGIYRVNPWSQRWRANSSRMCVCVCFLSWRRPRKPSSQPLLTRSAKMVGFAVWTHRNRD